MKLNLLLFCCLLITAKLSGQDNLSYVQKAAQLQKEIWGNPVPEFKVTTIPDKFAKESAVVIARSYAAQRTSNGKLKFLLVTAAVTMKTVKLNTFHERVKINDKSALEKFSTIAYQKKLDKTANFFIVKFANSQNTFIGAKIVKPDGREIIIDTSEEVLTKDQGKDKQGKLAISGLQVGDVLDYYVSSIDISEQADGDSYKTNEHELLLVDEYPVLYYNIDFQFNKSINVKYIYANGAPHFTESRNSAGDLLLNVKLRDLPKYKSQLWTSPLRQYPYIKIGSSYTIDVRTKDRMINKASNMFEGNNLIFQSAFVEYADFDEIGKKTKNFFDGSKAMKAAPLDTVMKVLYDQWKFQTFGTYSEDQLSAIDEMNYRTANNKRAAITLSMVLADMKVDHEVLLVASRHSNTLENAYTMDDFDAMIRVNGANKPIYMAFDDVVTHFNEIPAAFEGERAVALRPKRQNALKYNFTTSETTVPVSTSDKNQVHEQLKISLVPSNMQKLKVERSVKQMGAMRHSDQKSLIPVQEIDNSYMILTKGESLSKRLSRVKKTKKMTDDYDYVFNKERAELSKKFSAEIKSKFDQEPEQLSDFKIVKHGLFNRDEAFEYQAAFVLNNLVKKAGNNYIIDAGKLTGGFVKLDDKDKIRDADVYMSAARNFKYTLSIAIPVGFSVKGVEELNQNKSNQTGSFSSEAKVAGNVLTINIHRVYNNNFESAKNWDLLKEIIDSASDFNERKILLEKNI